MHCVVGWINSEARQWVCCFLTRGDLWQHWEEGAKVFELYLIDHDWYAAGVYNEALLPPKWNTRGFQHFFLCSTQKASRYYYLPK